jgi:hypothetical protein
MKYIALEGLQNSAKKLGNLDLFILASEELGKLIMTANLTLLEVTKSSDYHEWALNFAAHMKARSDSALKARLIEDEMKKFLITRAKAERTVQKQIKTYETLFKEFVNQ